MTGFPGFSQETHAVQLYHLVRVRHRSTGAPVTPLAAELVEPAWPHWILRRRGGDVLLAAEDRYAGGRPQTTSLRLSVSSPGMREVLEDEGEAAVDLQRGAAVERLVELRPAQLRLVIELVDRAGAAVGGRNVTVRGSSGSSVALTEGATGVYESPLRAWGPEHRQLRVRVNTRDLERRVAIDFGRAETRVRVRNV